MLSYNELKKGTIFVLDGEPWKVLEYEFLRMQQRKPVTKCKIVNLVDGKIVERAFHSSESFEEAEIVREEVKYLYTSKNEYWFCKKDDPSKRFTLKEAVLGNAGKFLKANTIVTALKFGELVISVEADIKMDLLVKDAPPSIKGNTAQGGTKKVTLETGAEVDVPLFIDAGDIVRVNTETGLYVERMEKAK